MTDDRPLDPASRRRVLQAGAATGLTAAAGCLGETDDTEPTDASDGVQFALISPFTGDFAPLGEASNQGMRQAVDFVNESDAYDFEIAYEEYDTGTDPTRAASVGQEALDDGAEFLVGPIWVESAIEVSELARDNEVIYMPMSGGTLQTGAECHEYLFRAETNSGQVAEVIARYTAENLGSRVLYSVPDTFYGHSVRETVDRRMEELSDDYEEVEAVFPAQDANDLEPFVNELMNHTDEADVVVQAGTGGHIIRFLAEAAQQGLRDEIPIITDTGSFSSVRDAVGPASYGVYSGVRWLPEFETGDNQDFVQTYQERYDEQPDTLARAGYQSIRMLANGIQEADSHDPDVVKDVLPGMTHDTVFGEVAFRECNNQAANPVWVGRNVEPEEGEMADVEVLDEMSGEEAAPPCETTGCEL